MISGNKKLIDYLTVSQMLSSPRIIKAFSAIDRADFVTLKNKPAAYFDIALDIGFGQTISQPSTVAFMLELLQVMPEDKVLDVGAGSGWTAALLSKLTGNKGRVIAVERIPDLLDFAHGNLLKYNLKNIKLKMVADKIGSLDEAPFDKILVSAAASKLPKELISQLRLGGKMAIPIGQSLWLITRKKGYIEKYEFPGFLFVPLI